MTAGAQLLGALVAAAGGALLGHARRGAEPEGGARARYAALALGAALFAWAGEALGAEAARAGLAAGAGLLGAGAILRYGVGAAGLGRAAALWAAVAVGAAAAPAPLGALLGAALAAAGFRWLGGLERLFVHADRLRTLRLTATSPELALRATMEALDAGHALLKRLRVEKDEMHKHAELEALLEFPPGAGDGPEDLRRALAVREGVLAVEIA